MNVMNRLFWKVQPRLFPDSGYPTLSASELAEEENWTWYTPYYFYPVSIGDVLHSKYQVLFKFGYGTTSTIWLCRDLHHNQYVCMKSMVCDHPAAEREIKAMKTHPKGVQTGSQLVRHALDHFTLRKGDHTYRFLIHEPLGISLQYILNGFRGHLPIDYVRDIAFEMFVALNYLHGAQIIHADIQAKNILYTIADPRVLKDSEEAEFKDPSARKISEDTVIFQTRDLPGPIDRWIAGSKSQPVLCDFGEARTGKGPFTGIIQPPVYRAPEVFLGLPWGKAVDVWNLVCMIWHLIFGEQLFKSREDAPDESEEQYKHHSTQMVSLIGPPPPQLLNKLDIPIPESFDENRLESLLQSSLRKIGAEMSAEDSLAFLGFIRKTLRWTAEERPTAIELVRNPWVAKGKNIATVP
ncbi:kinase-like domain-containing protein [Lentinula raphanica]|nr:kinase-like domain-containing protein [Lentinula raphanica]